MTLQSQAPAPFPVKSDVGAVGDGAAPRLRPGNLPRGRESSRLLVFIVPALLVVLAIVAGGTWFLWFRGPAVRADLVAVPVEYKDLQLKIVERGTLEAKENRDVKCEVKTGSRGAPKIRWVVDNGAYVKGPRGEAAVAAAGLGALSLYNKGDLLVEIDDSYLQEQATNQRISRDKAENDMIAAEQLYPAKKIAIDLAKQTLQKWIKGDFPQQLHDLEGKIQNADSTVLQQQDRTAWVARMVKKGYQTPSQEEAEIANLTGDNLSLQQLKEQRTVLTDYTDPVNRQTFENAIKQAVVDERTAYSNMQSTEAVFRQQDNLYKDLLEQIKQCRVSAEYSGIVVYTVPEQTRSGSGATQSIIAQGEPVQYGQKMLSIPDLKHMLVNVRIHEAFINNMRVGLPTTVRVDAVPGKTLQAHVRSVANVAAQQDWMSPDVKVYQAYVEIDDDVDHLKLKPGLSAATTIYTETKAEHVLAVPVDAVLSPLERGGKPRCFVLTAKGPEAREVELGMKDEVNFEIKHGLDEGEKVILNPRTLLSDKEKKGTKQDEKIVPTGVKPGGPGRQGGDRGGFPGGPTGRGGAGQPSAGQ